MAAEALNCLTCGAAMQADDDTSCRYCGARLATVACPACFGMMFAGSKHCPHCGSEASRGPADEGAGLTCPDCRVPLIRVQLGDTPISECARCFGIWLDPRTFERICAEREQQAAVLGKAVPQEIDVHKQWRYLPCPRCQQLMCRVNFADRSGVIIDICKAHGVWFEREELRRIVDFIRAGGMKEAREMQIERLERERQRLAAERRADAVSRADSSIWGTSDAGVRDALFVASGVLSLLDGW